MTLSIAEKIKLAQSAEGEELWRLLREQHPDIILNATLNKNLTEEMAIFIAKSPASPSDALGFLAGDVRFKNSYKLKLAVCRNPKTPLRVALSLLKFLRLFDLGDMTKNHRVYVNLRQKIELMLSEKISGMPSGMKSALSKRSNSNIVLRLMEKGDKTVISSCLDSPVLTERHLSKIINRAGTKPLVIKMIAGHPKWSLRYEIRFALIRNFHTPMSHVMDFIGSMKTVDLKYLYSDGSLPVSTKPFIFRELKERGEATDIEEEEVYPVEEDEDSCLRDENF